jgi:hypothetical protein
LLAVSQLLQQAVVAVVAVLEFSPALVVGQVVAVALLLTILFTPAALAQAVKAILAVKAHTSPVFGKVVVAVVEQERLELMHLAV